MLMRCDVLVICALELVSTRSPAPVAVNEGGDEAVGQEACKFYISEESGGVARRSPTIPC